MNKMLPNFTLHVFILPRCGDFLLGGAATAATATATSKVQAPETPRPQMQALQKGYVGQYQGGVYLLPATDETVQWDWFDNAEPPRARINDSLDSLMFRGCSHPAMELQRMEMDHTGFPAADHPGHRSKHRALWDG